MVKLPTDQPATVYTVGHSQRPLEEFILLLKGHAIGCLIDVRARPESRRHPHFSRQLLGSVLGNEGIDYRWEGRDLGGLRSPYPCSPNRALHGGMQAYADHMHSAEFRAAIDRALTLAATAPTALMCAERDPMQCHRRLIADHLTLRGVRVLHLIEDHRTVVHQLHPQARPQNDMPIYDLHDPRQLSLYF